LLKIEIITHTYLRTAYFVTGSDIGKYTIKTVDDIRTVNKTVHFRPPKNFLTLNELAAIWEKKISKTLPRVCISEQDLLAIAKGIFALVDVW
jgi:leucoanthocyanidin reductase